MAAKQQSPIVAISMLGISFFAIFGMVKGLQQVDERIKAMPVKGAQTLAQKSPTNPAEAKSIATLYPLLIESQTKQAVQNVEKGQLDSAFSKSSVVQRAPKKDEPPPAPTLDKVSTNVPPPIPLDSIKGTPPGLPNPTVDPNIPAPIVFEPVDYFTHLKDYVRIDAVVTNGAIINGKVYYVGDSLDKFAYPSKKNPASMATPVLKAVSGSEVEIAEADPLDKKAHRSFKKSIN